MENNEIIHLFTSWVNERSNYLGRDNQIAKSLRQEIESNGYAVAEVNSKGCMIYVLSKNRSIIHKVTFRGC